MKQRKIMVSLMLALGMALAPMDSGLQKAQASEHEEMAIPALALAPIAYEMMLGVTILFNGTYYAYFADKIALPSAGDRASLSRLRNLKKQARHLTEAQQVDRMINSHLLKAYRGLKTAIEFAGPDAEIDMEVVEAFIYQYQTVCGDLAHNGGHFLRSPEVMASLAEMGFELMSVDDPNEYAELSDSQINELPLNEWATAWRVQSLSSIYEKYKPTRNGCFMGMLAVRNICAASGILLKNIGQSPETLVFNSAYRNHLGSCQETAKVFQTSCQSIANKSNLNGYSYPIQLKARHQLTWPYIAVQACQRGYSACEKVSYMQAFQGTHNTWHSPCSSGLSACQSRAGIPENITNEVYRTPYQGRRN